MIGRWCVFKFISLCLAGLPGRQPPTFTPMLFWCCVITVGHLWRRLVKPYRSLPLCLARLVDPLVSEGAKVKLARWLLSLRECCLCAGFLKPLRSLVHSVDDCLYGIGQHILQSAFHGKSTNIEVETNFARAGSMLAATRGRSDKTPSMFAKHVLAEMKASHQTILKRENIKMIVWFWLLL